MFREQGIRFHGLQTLEFCAKLGSELGGQYSSFTPAPETGRVGRPSTTIPLKQSEDSWLCCSFLLSITDCSPRQRLWSQQVYGVGGCGWLRFRKGISPGHCACLPRVHSTMDRPVKEFLEFVSLWGLGFIQSHQSDWTPEKHAEVGVADRCWIIALHTDQFGNGHHGRRRL